MTIPTTICTVIVTFNGEPWISRCLQSLRDSERATHTIVVDNGSSDGTVALVQTHFPEVELIQSPINLGFGGGNNIGISKALGYGCEFVFLLNQDAYVTAGALGELTDFLHENTGFGVASPLHCSPDLQTIDAKTYNGYLRSHAEEWFCDAALGRAKSHYKVYGLNAAAWMVRAAAFRTVGGFDPLFFMYGEDDDLLRRFAHHQVAFALLPGSRIVHLRQSPPAPAITGWWAQVRKQARRFRSDMILCVKHPHYSRAHMWVELLANALLIPLAEFLLKRNLQRLVAHLLAGVQTISEFAGIRRHAKLCASAGKHFLDARPERSGT